jgi:hypothetical protein
LLLKAVELAAEQDGVVSRGRWRNLAVHFGYDPRGTAGFFVDQRGGGGLLEMDKGAGTVRVLPAGSARVTEFAGYVAQHEHAIRVALAATDVNNSSMNEVR